MITPTQEHKFTSDQPYNRHKYKLVFVDGRSIVFDDYGMYVTIYDDYFVSSRHYF